MGNTPHVTKIKKVARLLGYTTKTYKDGGVSSITVKISDPNSKKLLIVSPKDTGFYPDTLRWFKTLANSKILSEQILRDLGYNPIKSVFFTDYTESKPALTTKIKKLTRFPYVLKPEEGNKGKGIVIAANESELLKHTQKFYREKRQFMAQPLVLGTEYRILVISGKVQVAHAKEFPSVTADGKQTVRSLIKAASYPIDKNFLKTFLRAEQLKETDIPEKGVKIPIHITRKGGALYYSNLNPTKQSVPKHIQKWGTQLAKALSTKTLGVDVFMPDDATSIDSAIIIEINASPGFIYLEKRYKDKITVDEICKKMLRAYFS